MHALRQATRDEHDLLEKSLGLGRTSLSIAHYVHLLEVFYGYYEPLEKKLSTISTLRNVVSDLESRRKATLLSRDLQYWQRDTQKLRQCARLPQIEDVVDALACMYVLEGATLGGRVITPLIEDELGIACDTGGAFFGGYGERTSLMWRAFGRSFAEVPLNEAEHARVLEGAIATFRTIRVWCLENLE
jgi:heme oxygenase